MSLEDRLANIEAMTSVEKKEEWRRLMKSPPPPAFGAGLMGQALAYHEQERALGGLSSKDLKRIKCGATATANTASVVKAGTWLSRIWHGEAHQVIVLEHGVEYRGDRYASLSAVARKITGTRWSGPRFFGLHSPRLGKMGVTANA